MCRQVHRIAEGTIPRGGMSPSEPDLATEMNVSRATANNAVTLLRAIGNVKVM